VRQPRRPALAEPPAHEEGDGPVLRIMMQADVTGPVIPGGWRCSSPRSRTGPALAVRDPLG
jgi:hypothetical protein